MPREQIPEQVAKYYRTRQSSQDAPRRRMVSDVATDDYEPDDDTIYDTRMPTSVRRYHQPDDDDLATQHVQVVHHQPPRRASAQAPTQERRAHAAKQTTAQRERPRVHWLVPTGITMISMLVLYLAGNAVYAWGVNQYNDLHYGRPRTFQVDARVGHNDAQTPSHFLALNLNGQVLVIEFPGGDATKAKVYIGPTLPHDQSMDPVTLEFQDVNGDGKPDMIIVIAENVHIEVAFINDNGSFRPAQASDHIHL
jgi:hypothetical protein